MQTKTLLSRAGITVVAALAISSIGGMPALADGLGPTVSVSPSPVCLAHDFTVTGTGQAPGSYEVSISNVDSVNLVDPASLSPITVDGTGAFSTTLTARPDAPAGDYTATFAPTDAAGTLFTAPVTATGCLSTAVPTIAGSAIVGTTLTAKPGIWTTGTTFAYQWYAAGTAIPGATAPTFRLTTLQDGKSITVKVTGSKTGYAIVARTSVGTKLVMRPATPKISGYAAVGLTLKAVPGTWSPGTTFSYHWYANGTAITGASASAFKLTAAQRDKRISVRVTGSKSGYPTVARTSASTLRTTLSGPATITGTPLYGKTLTAHHGTWATGTAFSYHWYANGVYITGATRSTLYLGTSLKTKNITVKVTGTKSGYATVVRTSPATLKVATASTPTISGTKQVGKILTAHPGTWTTGTAFAYQWYVSGTAITGAKYSTLKLTAGTKGKRITVKVTGRKYGYPTIAKVSAATAAIAAAPRCDPNYAWACVPIASDVDCAGGGGNGPAYVVGPVKVIGVDIYRLDSDHDGIGCE
ncbi:hypothetical protein [Microbacterium mangrovi]|uniref:hypothetical protein n=1 Tax=Microbacterium mangrovi TaxID=1348253 RepID=UPI00068AB806|nr:hypothetical protein [Microbacterium mangrovi]